MKENIRNLLKEFWIALGLMIMGAGTVIAVLQVIIGNVILGWLNIILCILLSILIYTTIEKWSVE